MNVTVINGDVCSMLYTNSSAMHSHLMREFSPNISSAPFNTLIVIYLICFMLLLKISFILIVTKKKKNERPFKEDIKIFIWIRQGKFNMKFSLALIWTNICHPSQVIKKKKNSF